MSYKKLQRRIDSSHGIFDQSGIDCLIPHQFPTSLYPDIPTIPLTLGYTESGLTRSIVTEAKICSVEAPNSYYCSWPAWRRSFSFQSALRTRPSKKIPAIFR